MERHVSPSVLVRVFSGQASGPEVENAVPHLARCQVCWDRAARVISELRREGLLARTADERHAVLVLLEKEEDQALRRLLARGRRAELRRLPTQQLGRITAEPKFLTLEMFCTLADEAASSALEDPHLGEETALVAHALAATLPKDSYPEPVRNDLQGEALAIVGNCRRLAGDWRRSAEALAAAQGHLQRGTGEPTREARLLSLQASLAADTGRLEKALGLLARASALYGEAQDAEAVAAVTVQVAGTLLAAGCYQEAIARAEEALSGLQPGEARLAMLARNIITASLVFLTRPAEALRNFLATQPFIKQLTGLRAELQAGYLVALLLGSLGFAREADKAFRHNIANWMEAELGAARSHLEQGSGEPARVARLFSLQASLATDMGHMDQALTLLARAAALYRQAKDPAAMASVTVQEAGTLLAAFRHEEAIARAEEALRSLPPGAARLEVLARNVMIASLVYLGRQAEALRHLAAVEPFCRQLGGLRTELQLGYLEALLLDALGYAREAAATFQNNIARGMEAGLYKDAFLLMLTQFEFLFRRGALDRAARACEEALDRLEEAGEDFHAPMKELWRALLTLVNARRLTDSHLLEARQYLVRCGNLSEPRAARGAVAFALPVWAGGPATPEVENAPVPASPAETAPATPAPSLDRPTVPIVPPDPAASLAEDGYKQALERYDRQLVAAGLAQCQGRIGETCRLLGISRTLLRAKLKRYFLTGSDAD